MGQCPRRDEETEIRGQGVKMTRLYGAECQRRGNWEETALKICKGVFLAGLAEYY